MEQFRGTVILGWRSTQLTSNFVGTMTHQSTVLQSHLVPSSGFHISAVTFVTIGLSRRPVCSHERSMKPHFRTRDLGNATQD